MRLQIRLVPMHVIWNAAGNVGHMDRNAVEWGEGRGIFCCGTGRGDTVFFIYFI